MQLWNTLTRRKDEFVAGPIVRIYVCGITPYATTHLGHARTYLTFDVLIREIERQGHIVRYAQNVTDVDDPLFERAQQMGITTAELARNCTRLFQDDLAALSVRPPDYFPRASDEIPDIQRMIGDLMTGGFAYQRGVRVYFRIGSSAGYGRFARLPRPEMLVSADDHGEDTGDPLKEDPLDFVLWTQSQPGETAWPSPWGIGRPGWHIECSAMALRYLGPDLDIHGGGTDLIYPHHENEIAQSEASTGHIPMARYWIHAGMVKLEGVKMSKSLGNMVFVRDLRKRFSGAAIRHYLLNSHYRAEFEYSEAGMAASAAKVAQLERALAGSGRDSDRESDRNWVNRYDAALADDLNTPLALDILDGAAADVLSPPPDGIPRRDDLRQMAARLGLVEEQRE